MINENNVDLTGFAYNILCSERERCTSIFFTVSVKHCFKNKDEQYITQYDVIPCVIYGNKDEQGNYKRKSFDYIKKNLIEGQLIRVQGRLNTWIEGLIEGDLVAITNDNKKNATKIITRNIVKVNDYKLLESREVTLKRQEKQLENINREESKINLYNNLEFPVYRNFVSE